MSRHGRHGRPAHAGPVRPAQAPNPGPAPRPVAPVDVRPPDRPLPVAAPSPVPGPVPAPAPVGERPFAGAVAERPVQPVDWSNGDGRHDGGGDSRPMCTTAQLRRFIKSRPWVPMHELRRRFGIWGGDDDVSPMVVGDTTLFIGLPPAEAGMMTELLVGGDVGYELSLDPGAPIVVGVYPMRPVPRS
jgi:hypothetical protein